MTSYGPPEHAEYPLPVTDIPSEFRQRLHPWIAGFIGFTPAEANERLAKRWASIVHPSLKTLRETFSKFNVEAIVDQEPGGMIYAVRAGAGDMIGDSFSCPGRWSAGLSRDASSQPDLMGMRLCVSFSITLVAGRRIRTAVGNLFTATLRGDE